MTRRLSRRWAPVLLLVAVVVVAAAVMLFKGPDRTSSVHVTLAEVQPLRAPLLVGADELRGTQRLGAGAAVSTGNEGRGRLHLDDGTLVLLDRATTVRLEQDGLKLQAGRVFVQAGAAQMTVDMGAAKVVASRASLALERGANRTAAFCASGTITVQTNDGEQRVQTGETALLNGGKASVEPETAFEDWTGGMAAPWSSEHAPRRSIGELWGRPSGLYGDPGAPLTIRATDVQARIQGELAVTKVRTTFFNAGSTPVMGDFRMPVPPEASIAAFSVEQDGRTQHASMQMAKRAETVTSVNSPRLEWAGYGWVRGWVPNIAPGATVTIALDYTEWLSPSNGRLTYRYRLAGSPEQVRIGEFSAAIDLRDLKPRAVHVGAGATVEGAMVRLHKSDWTPVADLVVQAELPEPAPLARAYLETGPSDGDGYLIVRTELPKPVAEQGVALVLVLDTSMSTDAGLLDAQRAFADAVLNGLSSRDRIAVMAASEVVRFVGPEDFGPLTAERRKQLETAIGQIRSGGGTDLAQALERAADMIPADAPAAMVVYVGDGWPTLGDMDMSLIEARLARRPAGMPRLAAVALGPVANRYGLASLARWSGVLLHVTDRTDAAQAAADLLASSLQPSVAGVQIDFPPGVDRIYPRGSHPVAAGSTFQAAARWQANAPKQVTIRWRDAKGSHEQTRSLQLVNSPEPWAVRREWARARIEELGFRQQATEAATSVAFAEKLLTPWTAWVMGDDSHYAPTPMEVRMLDLNVQGPAPFVAKAFTPPQVFGAIADPIDELEEQDDGPGDEQYAAAIRLAGQRLLWAAAKQIRACHEARAALRPDLTGSLRIRVQVSPDGKLSNINVEATSSTSHDPALQRCVEAVVSGIVFPPFDLARGVDVELVVALPPARALHGSRCSAVSTLPASLRRGLWLERLRSSTAADVYAQARQACELRTWNDKRVLLELMLERTTVGRARVALARELAQAGDQDAAQWLERETLRRVRTPDELQEVRQALLELEQVPAAAFRKAYKAATNDAARLAVVHKFLLLAPHHNGLRRLRLALLANGESKDDSALLQEVESIRHDPLADTALLSECAAVLARRGRTDQAKQTYAELAERAPFDPAVRAFYGDRLRAQGWYDDAIAAYQTLENLSPADSSVLLRQALAYQGAGRLDIAARHLTRLAQTGGPTGDRNQRELGGPLAASLFANTLADQAVSEADRELAKRRAMALPWTPGAMAVLVHAPALHRPVQSQLVRGEGQVKTTLEPQVAAPALGLAVFRLDSADDKFELVLRRPATLFPHSAVPVKVEVIRADDDISKATLASWMAQVDADDQPVRVRYDGRALVSAP